MQKIVCDEIKGFNKPESALDYFKNKLAFTLGPIQLNKFINTDHTIQIIDVRNPEDYAQEHIPGAKNIPEDNWQSFLLVNKEKINIFYSYSQQCPLAAYAAYHFAKNGFRVMMLEGGYAAWKEHNLACVV